MRRNSSDDGTKQFKTVASEALANGRNVGDLIYRFEKNNDAKMREILSSPQMQNLLADSAANIVYYRDPEISPNDQLQYIRYLQQQQLLRNRGSQVMMTPHLNDSLLSLTDLEFNSDVDQQQDFMRTTSNSSSSMFHGSRTKHGTINDLSRFSRLFEMLSRLPLPMSFAGMGFCFLVAVFISPRSCVEKLLFPAFRLIFGVCYPAYASYKAVRTKNVKEYVKWMMYWIVYAFLTFIETFTDLFLSWFPFYYEFKILVVIWLLCPATKGSSVLYRKFVHPMLTRREKEIDEYIDQAKEKGYTAVLQLGSKGVNVIMQTALKGGGNLVQTIRRSYSLSDLSEPDDQRGKDEIDEIGRPQRLLRPRSQTARSSSGGRNVDMYFSEVEVGPKSPPPNFNSIRSTDDISSGYSSAEPISQGLSRTASLTNATRPRFKAKRAEDDVYFESDEYEPMPEVRCSPNNPTLFSHYPNSQISYTRNLELRPRSDIFVNDWKDQAYFANEQYFQDAILKSRCENRRPDDKNHEGDAIILNENRPSTLEIEKKESANFKVPESTIKMPKDMADKYELFCKWLENNEKQKTKTQDTPNAIAGLEKKLQSLVEDEFKDTVSDDETFLDTESVDNSSQLAPSLSKTALSENMLLLASLNSVENNRKKSGSTDSTDCELSLPSLLDDFNASRKDSVPEIRRPAAHKKRKAPDPPNHSLAIDSSTSQSGHPVEDKNLVETETEITYSSLLNPDIPETVENLATGNRNPEIISNLKRTSSRSPSPRSDAKKSGKINLFRSYLPSIFRSESPKPNPSSDDYSKESQI